MSNVKMMPCSCTNKYQDVHYGRTQRVHNVGVTGDKARCTVCGNVKTFNKEKKVKGE